MNPINNGVWPTMVTPYTDGNEIDYPGVERMIEWYDRQGVAGIFAVCQSSEMFYLSIDERVELAKFVVQHTPPHIKVIASGHIAPDAQTQIDDALRIIDTGIDAYVFIASRLANPGEGDDVWKRNVECVIDGIDRGNGGKTMFGVYECPSPYHRLISPELLKHLADSGRFWFLKDTCCNPDLLKRKLDAIRGTHLKLFNAHTPTLLYSLRLGAAGYSGVMANFHADLYAWLCEHYEEYPDKAEQMQAWVGALSVMQYQCYPINAKYHLTLEGVDIGVTSRTRDVGTFNIGARMETEQLQDAYRLLKKQYLCDGHLS